MARAETVWQGRFLPYYPAHNTPSTPPPVDLSTRGVYDGGPVSAAGEGRSTMNTGQKSLPAASAQGSTGQHPHRARRPTCPPSYPGRTPPPHTLFCFRLHLSTSVSNTMPRSAPDSRTAAAPEAMADGCSGLGTWFGKLPSGSRKRLPVVSAPRGARTCRRGRGARG